MADRVTVSVTHQFDINNDKAWVKVEYSTDAQENETPEQAIDRANTEIQNKIISVIESSAQTVIDYESGAKK